MTTVSKIILSLLLLGGSLPAQAQMRVERITLEGSPVGLGFTTNTKMRGNPAVFGASASVHLRGGWVVAPEVGSTGFRDAIHTDKVGLIISTFVRYQHNYWGLRLGKGFVIDSLKKQVVVSTGVNYLTVAKPEIERTGFLGPIYDYPKFHFINVPVQLDFLFPFLNKKNFFTVTARYNFNTYHRFLTIGAGLKFMIYKNRKDRRRTNAELLTRVPVRAGLLHQE